MIPLDWCCCKQIDLYKLLCNVCTVSATFVVAMIILCHWLVANAHALVSEYRKLYTHLDIFIHRKHMIIC